MRFAQSQRLRAACALGAVVAIIILLIMWTRTDSSSSVVGEEAKYPDWRTAEQLVSRSDGIIVASLASERTEKLELRSPVDNAVHGTETAIVRTYRVEAVLKGAVVPSGTIDVWFGKEGERDSAPGGPRLAYSQEVPGTPAGTPLMLFLSNSHLPDGEQAWFLNGEPAVAEVRGNELFFRTTKRFREDLATAGVTPAKRGSDAPFEVTVDQLRALISTAPASPGAGQTK